MSAGTNDFTAHIREAPTIEISHNVVYVRDRSGNMRIERAMSLKSFEKYVERGRRALERYEKGEETIIVDD